MRYTVSELFDKLKYLKDSGLGNCIVTRESIEDSDEYYDQFILSDVDIITADEGLTFIELRFRS